MTPEQRERRMQLLLGVDATARNVAEDLRALSRWLELVAQATEPDDDLAGLPMSARVAGDDAERLAGAIAYVGRLAAGELDRVSRL